MKRSGICQAVLALALLAPICAQADFTLCNTSASHDMRVAWVLQRGQIFKGPYEVGGWFYVNAGRCEQLASGDAASNSIWIHAVSEGVVLTRDGIDGLSESDLQLCVGDGKFAYKRAEASSAQSCGQGYYLAPFPIFTWNSDDVDDLTIKLNPDDQVRRNPGAASSRRAQLPDVHGALAESSGYWFGSMFHDTREAAQRAALTHCRLESKGVCRVEVAFRNQCVAVARGRGPAAVTLGQTGWTQQQTLNAALKKCAQSGDTTCGESIAFCSTQEAKVAEQNRRDTEGQQKVLGLLGNALGAIWGIPPTAPAPSPPPEPSLESYRSKAERGDPVAQHELGVAYQNGEGAPQDYALAAYWYAKAAAQGYPGSMLNLGGLYQLGHGVKQDAVTASEWYRKAALLGDSDAQANLAMLYHQGLGLAKDYGLAAEWYQKAAMQGHPGARRNLEYLRKETGLAGR